MQSFYMKKVPSYFIEGRGDTMLYLQIFSHFLKFIPTFVVQTMTFQAKNYLATVFKVIRYGFEILSLNCKII